LKHSPAWTPGAMPRPSPAAAARTCPPNPEPSAVQGPRASPRPSGHSHKSRPKAIQRPTGDNPPIPTPPRRNADQVTGRHTDDPAQKAKQVGHDVRDLDAPRWTPGGAQPQGGAPDGVGQALILRFGVDDQDLDALIEPAQRLQLGQIALAGPERARMTWLWLGWAHRSQPTSPRWPGCDPAAPRRHRWGGGGRRRRTGRRPRPRRCPWSGAAAADPGPAAGSTPTLGGRGSWSGGRPAAAKPPAPGPGRSRRPPRRGCGRGW
jgi:hypothetical protein